MKRRENNNRSVRRGAHLLWSLLATALLFQACGVTEPQSDVWEDVGSFSWPTESGTLMKFQLTKAEVDGKLTTLDEFVTVEMTTEEDEDAVIDNRQMFALIDDKKFALNHVRFLPTADTLYVKRDIFGSGLALVAPIEKGHRWLTSEIGNYEAEIVELFSWRKIEGKVYENVVAVRYRKLDPETDNPQNKDEYIRFYAKGVGEVMTIKISYPSADAPVQTIPAQDERRVLLETRPAS